VAFKRRVLVKLLAAIAVGAVLGTSFFSCGADQANARQCARICQGGVCWWDCSKIPGQTSIKLQR